MVLPECTLDPALIILLFWLENSNRNVVYFNSREQYSCSISIANLIQICYRKSVMPQVCFVGPALFYSIQNVGFKLKKKDLNISMFTLNFLQKENNQFNKFPNKVHLWQLLYHVIFNPFPTIQIPPLFFFFSFFLIKICKNSNEKYILPFRG